MTHPVKKIQTICPHCGARYHVDAEYVGKHINCKKCPNSFPIEPPRLTSLTVSPETTKAHPLLAKRTVVAGSVAFVGISALLSLLYIQAGNRERADVRERLTDLVDSKVDESTRASEAFDLDAANRALVSAETAIGDASVDTVTLDLLTAKVSEARRALRSAAALFTENTKKGLIVFDGRMIQPSERDRILAELRRRDEEEARTRAAAEAAARRDTELDRAYQTCSRIAIRRTYASYTKRSSNDIEFGGQYIGSTVNSYELTRTAFRRVFETIDPTPFVLFQTFTKDGCSPCYPTLATTECAALVSDVAKFPAESSREYEDRKSALQQRGKDWLARVGATPLCVAWDDVAYAQSGTWSRNDQDSGHESRLLAEYDADAERLSIRFWQINHDIHTYSIINVPSGEIELRVARADISPDRQHYLGVLAVACFRVIGIGLPNVDSGDRSFQHDLQLIAFYILSVRGGSASVLAEWSSGGQ